MIEALRPTALTRAANMQLNRCGCMATCSRQDNRDSWIKTLRFDAVQLHTSRHGVCQCVKRCTQTNANASVTASKTPTIACVKLTKHSRRRGALTCIAHVYCSDFITTRKTVDSTSQCV